MVAAALKIIIIVITYLPSANFFSTTAILNLFATRIFKTFSQGH